MRIKDEEKRRALFEATIKVVHELGFASSSVSKIAKEAGVSPSTLYIYHKNKEDLLAATYMEVKRAMGQILGGEFNESTPVYDVLQPVWRQMFEYTIAKPLHYRYVEQFTNSPYMALIDQTDLQQYSCSILQVIQRGIEQKIIKDVDQSFLAAFLFHPIPFLANARIQQGRVMTEAEIKTAFTMAWDAIKR